MVVTHLFQVLGFVAMEPPTSLAAKPLRDEKSKVYDALRPIDVRHVVRGQYEGYRSIDGVPKDSDTETMIALRVEVENWRWHGVPFYLRSGKALARRVRSSRSGSTRRRCGCSAATGRDAPTGQINEIVIDFADPGSISIEFMAKMPGPEMTLGASKLTFRYEDSFAASNALEGYERLILLAMLGDQSLFTRADGIDRVWEISQPLLDDAAARPAVRARARGGRRGREADRPVQLVPAVTDRPALARCWRGGVCRTAAGARCGTRRGFPRPCG